MPLVNDSLKFTSSDTQICRNFLLKNVSSFCSAKVTHIFSAKNIGILYIESAKTVNEMILNELVKLTTLCTTGPWVLTIRKMHLETNGLTNEPQCQKTNLRTNAPSKDSDQSAHSRSLIRIFTGRIFDSQGCKASPWGQRRLLSDCVDAQADLSLRWTHITEGTFA